MLGNVTRLPSTNHGYCVCGLTSIRISLRHHFYKYGEIKSVVIIEKAKCAFVNFFSRQGAERAASGAYNNCRIKGRVIRVQWARSKATNSATEAATLLKERVSGGENQ
jgi:RNA recognition motif-containing protein